MNVLQISTPVIRHWAWLAFHTALWTLLIPIQSSQAQQWPVDQIPNQHPVPQYVPSAQNQGQAPMPATRPTALQPKLPDFFDRNPINEGPAGSSKSSNILLAPNPLANQRLEPSRNTPSSPMAVKPFTNPTLPQSGQHTSPQIPRNTFSETVPAHSTLSSQQNLKPSAPAVATTQPTALIDYALQRDFSRYPIDPRKPCPACSLGATQCRCRLLGNQGHPFLEKEPGGCQCDSHRPAKSPSFSVHWPRPFSALLDEHHPERAAARYANCQPKRVVDVFDSLSTFKLVNYKRSDTGYCGPGADRFGCLGESKVIKR